MKLVIDIPDHIYKTVVETGKYGYYRFDARKAIKKGIPLPKGQWIPVSNPRKELPKDHELWVTVDDFKYAIDHNGGCNYMGSFYVDTIYWDMTEWSEHFVDYVIAYMIKEDEPEPYRKEIADE